MFMEVLSACTALRWGSAPERPLDAAVAEVCSLGGLETARAIRLQGGKSCVGNRVQVADYGTLQIAPLVFA